MKNQESLEKFKKNNYFNKSEVINAAEDIIEHYMTSTEEEYGLEHKNALINSFNLLLNKIKGSHLPEMIDPWWYYSFSINPERVCLELKYCDNLELDDNGEIDFMESSSSYNMIFIDIPYVSVEEFAKIWNVTPTTVRQWIRRGKIRNALKRGRDWYIPQLNKRPQRGFEEATYSWKESIPELENQFPFLADMRELYIMQHPESSSQYKCILNPLDSEKKKYVTIDEKERGKLELALIGNDKVQVWGWCLHEEYCPNRR